MTPTPEQVEEKVAMEIQPLRACPVCKGVGKVTDDSIFVLGKFDRAEPDGREVFRMNPAGRVDVWKEGAEWCASASKARGPHGRGRGLTKGAAMEAAIAAFNLSMAE